MKFVYFGYDFMLPAIKRLMNESHELIGIFSFPCDNIFNFNRETLKLAKEHNIPLTLENPKNSAMKSFINRGAECFIAAGYPWKIPPVDEASAYAINLHPSFLPKGRGIMPVPHIIMNHPEAAGFTIHKMVQQFDAGDILYQEKINCSEIETVDSYSNQIADKGADALSKIMKDLPDFWNKATPQKQTQSSWFPPPDDIMRTLDWQKPLKELDRIARAFGSFGSLAIINGQKYAIYDHDIQPQPIKQKPGTLISQSTESVIIAALDGYFVVKKFDKI